MSFVISRSQWRSIFFFGFGLGTIVATGTPRLVMTTSSPASTAAMSSLRWDFASATLTVRSLMSGSS